MLRVRVREYTVHREPDFLSIGREVDRAIERGFPDGRYIVRAIGMDDHPNLTRRELVGIIRKTGWDKYDPARRAVGHDEFSGYDYDLQAGPIEIRGSRLIPEAEEPIASTFGGIAWHFYHGAPLDRGYSVRIDLLVLYDPSQLRRARPPKAGARRARKGLEKALYKFRQPDDKPRALRGLVEILR